MRADEPVLINDSEGRIHHITAGRHGRRKVNESDHPLGAIYVCQIADTLIQYRIIEHARSRQGSFYFNPRRDMLWLSFDFTDEPEHLRDLQRSYSEQLNTIETLLAEEIEWMRVRRLSILPTI